MKECTKMSLSLPHRRLSGLAGQDIYLGLCFVFQGGIVSAGRCPLEGPIPFKRSRISVHVPRASSDYEVEQHVNCHVDILAEQC